MSYPSFEKYNEAFQLHSKLLTDSELAKGNVKKTGLGVPLAISGGFALTYTIECGSKKYAVRCFHKESKSLEQRYLEISKKLKSLSSAFFLDFEFQPKGIIVDGNSYPIIKMAWAVGTTLGEFLDDNYDNQLYITNLSNALVKLSEYLEGNSVSHGDIQTGNLMISNSGSSIQLIDYDGMYIDSIASLGSAELGHINFQHPYRAKLNPYNSKLDRFSLILLWLACKALATDSTIWNKTKSDQDSVVFRSTDFTNPNASQTFALLSTYPALKEHVKNFAAICNVTKLESIPSLSDFITGLNIPNLSNVHIISKNVSRAVIVNEYVSPYPVISAMDYNACLQQIGNQVEVIGKITDVTQNFTRYGKPYVFINFGDWKGNIFKITIWSEGLDAIIDKPDSSWIGKWVSIKGLMEAPYKSKKYKYSHISITVSKKGQYFIIDEIEAKKRLTYKKQSSTVNNSSIRVSNKDILTQITGQSISVKNSQSVSTNSTNTAKSSNQAILSKIHSTTSNTINTSSNNAINSSNRKPITTANNQKITTNSQVSIPTNNSSQNNVRKGFNGEQVITWVIWIVIILVALKACS
ncbi:protein kinase family protein [Acinetobacter sp. YH01004]|uniref:protein kinase family protein n=1 Tax=Acinetobacter sp. YH01004 TaxID=2601020 RepID=UPI0015D3531C|nr:protein kinase family protein [Acinetobacter sp. YH01004]